MSDSSQGPGWWQASDGKWYPPEQAPGQAPVPNPARPGGSVDIGAALGYGWNKFVANIGPILAILLVIVGARIVFLVFDSVIGSGDGVFASVTSFFFQMLGIFVMFLLSAGVIRAALAITRGEAPTTSLLWSTENLANFAVASVIVSLLIFVGFFALCIGALVVAIFTFFYGFYAIDRGDSATDSIANSFKLVRDNFGGVVLFVVVASLLNFFTCGLAVGVTYIAGAYVYKTLNGEAVAA
jgi:uncharacterized membrane protein